MTRVLDALGAEVLPRQGEYASISPYQASRCFDADLRARAPVFLALASSLHIYREVLEDALVPD